MKRALQLALLVCIALLPARAQLTFSGLVMYSADASGAQNSVYWWESTGSGVANVYTFTGSVASPTFLTSGDTDASLDAKYALTPGTHTILFVANTVPESGNIGLNFYFDSDLAHNRISATVPVGGSSAFSVIDSSTTTYHQTTTGPGSGMLSYTSGGVTATLTDLRTFAGPQDLVSYTGLGANETPDIAGSFTLTVTAVPEPAAIGFVGAAAALAAAAWQKRRLSQQA
jgi:hypothetical protein